MSTLFSYPIGGYEATETAIHILEDEKAEKDITLASRGFALDNENKGGKPLDCAIPVIIRMASVPENPAAVEHRAVRAAKLILPVTRTIVQTNADHAGLACAHAAGHHPLKANLTRKISIFANPGY